MVLSCLYGVKLVFHLKKKKRQQVLYCSMLVLCGGNLVCLISEKKKKKNKKETKKDRKKEKTKTKKKHVGKHVVFHACRATSLYSLAACVAVSL